MTMLLSEHYHAAQLLSPKAASLAARLLDAAVDVSFEWRVTLRMVLTDRARGVAEFTTTDLAPLPPTAEGDQRAIPPYDQARLFMLAVQTDAAAQHAQAMAGTPRAGEMPSS